MFNKISGITWIKKLDNENLRKVDLATEIPLMALWKKWISLFKY